MTKTKYRQKRLTVYASDGGITIHGDIHVGAHDLTPEEHKKLVCRVIRRIPRCLRDCPFRISALTTFQFQNGEHNHERVLSTIESFSPGAGLHTPDSGWQTERPTDSHTERVIPWPTGAPTLICF